MLSVREGAADRTARKPRSISRSEKMEGRISTAFLMPLLVFSMTIDGLARTWSSRVWGKQMPTSRPVTT